MRYSIENTFSLTKDKKSLIPGPGWIRAQLLRSLVRLKVLDDTEEPRLDGFHFTVEFKK